MEKFMKLDHLFANLYSRLAFSTRTAFMMWMCAGLVTEIFLGMSLKDAPAAGIIAGNRYTGSAHSDQPRSGIGVEGDSIKAIPVLSKNSQNQKIVEKVVHEGLGDPSFAISRHVALAESLTDADIHQHVKTMFALDPFLEEHEIEVSVNDQHVTLSGAVDYEQEKSRAEELASHVNGVAAVTNDLVVLSEWTWQSDVEIQGRIITGLRWSPFVDSDEIDVTVEQGTAILTGVVDSWTECVIAEENAYEGGAKNVVNKLKLRALVGG